MIFLELMAQKEVNDEFIQALKKDLKKVEDTLRRDVRMYIIFYFTILFI